MEPKLVLMDELDSGIDVDALNRIFNAISYLKDLGATVLLITHSMEVLKHAEHAFLLCCGRLQDKGSSEKIGLYFGSKCIPCNHQNNPDQEQL
jgi:Fe-S cluster assembly ATP-binding protein